MRRVGLVLGALVLVLGALAPAFAQQPFADVPLDHWAYSAVNGLAEKGLLEGYPDGTFKGKQALTRYEFAQAIARMMDRVEKMAKEPGPVGPAGPAGPAGAGGGLTAEQQALLDRLANEFAPELKALRSDLDSLTKRVEDLESKAPAKGPVINVSGDMSWRIGMYGTSLGGRNVESTGYPAAAVAVMPEDTASVGPLGTFYSPFGGITLPMMDWGWFANEDPSVVPAHVVWGDDPAVYAPFWESVRLKGLAAPGGEGVIAISDALKDAYKASRFLTQKTRVNFAGQLAENTDVKVSLWAGPTTNLLYPWRGDAADLSFNGLMDTVQINEAWVKYRTKLLTPVELTVGKQYFSFGQGLLANNDQETMKALRADWTTGSQISFGILLGMLDQEMFYGRAAGQLGLPSLNPVDPLSPIQPRTSGQDAYDLLYLNYAVSPRWNLGLNWLDSGFAEEQGWSLALDGKLYGLDFYSEYAKLTKWANGKDWNDFGKRRNNADGTYAGTDLITFDDVYGNTLSTGDGVKDPRELGLDESDTAWLMGLKWTGEKVKVTGEYGQVDAGYAFSFPMDSYGNPFTTGWGGLVGGLEGGTSGVFNLPFSLLHPRAEIDPHDINWIDRPLFLDPTNIARGWHLAVEFPDLLGKDTPVSISYASGDAYDPRYLSWLVAGGPNSVAAVSDTGVITSFPEPAKWRDADPVWIVKVSKKLSEAVSANLVYGRRAVDNVMSPGTAAVRILRDADGNPVLDANGNVINQFASTDAIQVLRAELCVAF